MLFMQNILFRFWFTEPCRAPICWISIYVPFLFFQNGGGMGGDSAGRANG